MLEEKILLLHLLFWHCMLMGLFLFVVHIEAAEIPLDSKLKVAEDNYWISSNGDFALRFFNRSDQPNQFSVGIRFNTDVIPASEQSVVWVAGADVGVGCDSYLHLTLSGDLVLFDSLKDSVAWASNTGNLSVASASLLDNGNLVLLNKSGIVVWQSFNTPTDTLLPGQNISIFQSLRAASRNSVSSYYTLLINNSGQLRLNWESSVPYWDSGTPSWLVSGAVFTKDGAFELLDRSSRTVWSRYGEDHNDSSVSFRFLRLDVDGNLRMYSWIDEAKSWRSVWQAVENQCNVFDTCGLCGICVFTPEGRASCKCPFGSASGPSSKCLAPYNENCASDTSMIALKHTHLYGVYPPDDNITKTSFEQCKTLCLQDPRCTSVTITNDGTGECQLTQTSYITGYEDPSLMSISYVKVCLDPLAAFPQSFPALPPNSPLRHSYKLCIPCVTGAASATLLGFAVIQIGIALYFFKKRKTIKKRVYLAYMDPTSVSRGLMALSYSEIMNLTENFKQQLGPKVFKGVLPNNQLVAIKDLKDIEKGVSIEEKQFKCTVSILGCIHHKNLLKLEGYCCEADRRLLVYEYKKNGSVAKWIEEAKLSKRLSWRKRLEICLGVARAMAYLHAGCREFICHGNLKWQNVVLDDELEAKVTEFGFRGVDDGACDGCGPAEHDISRFGDMVLRVVSGWLSNRDVCRWAYEEWAQGRAERVVDARIESGTNAEELERMLRIAFWCIQVEERLRPSMGEVVKVLEGTLDVDPPPSPFACQRIPGEPLTESDTELSL